MEALSSYSVGVWSVQTVTGTTYLLDLDDMLVVRQWDLSANNDNILRRDGDPISLVWLHHCEVGDPMLLLLDLYVTEVDFTAQISSTVLRIEWVDARFKELLQMIIVDAGDPATRRATTAGYSARDWLPPPARSVQAPSAVLPKSLLGVPGSASL